MVAASSQEL